VVLPLCPQRVQKLLIVQFVVHLPDATPGHDLGWQFIKLGGNAFGALPLKTGDGAGRRLADLLLWRWRLPAGRGERCGMTRHWGGWTEVKLDALQSYLHGFTTASSKALKTLYLDLFAGSDENYSRETGNRFAGSAERALAASPGFSRVVLCELDPSAVAGLEAALRRDHPGRDIVVLPGDCNESIPSYLASLRSSGQGWERAPTFAFLDQVAAEIRWETIEALARFRKGWRKTELWMYFGESFLPRGMGNKNPGEAEEFAKRIDAMYGTPRWREIHLGRRQDMLTGAELKHELVNLMRWRLEHDLGYAITVPLQITRDNGAGIYTMIFASDDPTGEKIMRHVSGKAADALEQRKARARMKRELAKRDAKLGIEGFDGLLEESISASTGTLRAPVQPIDEPVEPWRYPFDWPEED
jgi:three-Cys-motif partner protein